MGKKDLFNISFIFFTIAGGFGFFLDEFPHGIQNVGLMLLALWLTITDS